MINLESCPICQSNKFSDLIEVAAQMHPSDELFQFQNCDGCGLVFLNPRLDPKGLKDYYTDYYLPYRGADAWGKYHKQVAGSQVSLDKKRVALVASHSDMTKDSLVLDVGCGKPSFLKACRDKYGCRTLGIDFSDEGWKESGTAYASLELKVGEVKDLPQDLRPDVITMWHYLEHDYNPLQTLKDLKAISHEDTKLIIEVPNYDSDSRRKYGKHWAGFHTPRHTFLFTPDTLRLLLSASGWNPLEVNSFGTLDPYVLYWMSEMERKGIRWDKNMEAEFFNYVIGMIGFFPKRMFGKSLGIMTGVGGQR